MNLKVLLVILLLGVPIAADAYGSLRCEGRLIRIGDSQARVTSLCGAPADRSTETVPARARTAAGYSRFIGVTTTERWVFDRGWGKFPAVLIFNEGRVQSIEYLPHRSGDE